MPQLDSPRRVRAYVVARRGRDRLLRALGACFDGLWLGLLSREHLHVLDQGFYDDRSEYVDGGTHSYFDEEYNALGLSDWEEAVVREHFEPGCRVVVTGAGGGREVLALLEQGFDATGYEPHAGFVDAGAGFLRRRGHEPRLSVAQRDAFPAAAGPCDAVIVGWGSYMLIGGRARRVEFLRQARARLAEQDPILLSFFATSHRTPYFRVVATIANSVRRVRRSDPVEPGDTISWNYVHYFTPDEVADELRAGGFEAVAFEPKPYPHAVGRALPREVAGS